MEADELRKSMIQEVKQAAGANTQKRIREELNYLLNNYTPSNDNKIEMLIDEWRRRGDPSYDPAVKLR